MGLCKRTRFLRHALPRALSLYAAGAEPVLLLGQQVGLPSDKEAANPRGP